MFGFKFQSPVRIISAIALSGFVFGCTRNNDAVTSKVSLQLPDFSKVANQNKGSASNQKTASQSTSSSVVVQHISLNISGPGMAPIVWQWDQHGDDTAVPPTDVEFTVPRSSDARLVQVLVALGGDDSDNMTITYGDASTVINDAAVSVPITVTQIGSTTAGQGQIAGRYVDANGAGLTGKVAMRYAPPGSGKPSMIIDEVEIFGGWFSFFSLPGFPFEYRFSDGRILIKDAVDSPQIMGSIAGATARVKMPAFYRNQGSNGAPTYRAESARTYVLGFFGPGVNANNQIKYYAPGSSVAYSGSGNGLYSDSTGTTPLQWMGNSGTNASPSTQVTVIGGIADASPGNSTTCTSSSLCSMKLDHMGLTDDSGGLGFFGPFRNLATNPGDREFVGHTFTPGAANAPGALQVTWKYMPFVSNIAGAEIFVRSGVAGNNNGDSDYQKNHGIICESLVSEFGFSSVGRVAFGLADGNGLYSSTISNISSADYNSSQVQVVICPYSSSGIIATALGAVNYYDSAADLRLYQSGPQGGSVTSGAYTINTTTFSTNTSMVIVTGTFTNGANYVISGPGGTPTYCWGSASSASTFSCTPSGTPLPNSGTIHLFNGTGGGGPSVTGSSLANWSIVVGANNNNPPPVATNVAHQLKFISDGACDMLNIGAFDSSGNPAMVATGTTHTVTVSVTNGQLFPSNNMDGCTSGGSGTMNVTLSPGSSFQSLKFKHTSSASAPVITLVDAATGAAATNLPQAANNSISTVVRASGLVTRLMIQSPSTFTANSACVVASVLAQSSNGVTVAEPDGFSVTLSANGVNGTSAPILYDIGDTTCATPLSSHAATFSGGVAQFKIKSASTGTFHIEADSTINTYNFSIGYQIQYVSPGLPTTLSMSALTLSGSSSCQSMTVTLGDDVASASPTWTVAQTLSLNGQHGTFYGNSTDCAGVVNAIQSISIPASTNSVIVYFKGAGSPSAIVNLGVMVTGLSGIPNYFVGANQQ